MLRKNFPGRKNQRKTEAEARQKEIFLNIVKRGHSCTAHDTFESVYKGAGWCRKKNCK